MVMKIIRKFESYIDKNLDDVLDKISKHGYKNLSDKDKKYLKNWYSDKHYEKDIKYENDLYEVYVKNVEHINKIIIFYVELFDGENVYEGNVNVGYDGIIRLIDLFDTDTGEEFEAKNYYKFDKLFQEMLEDYLTKKENSNFIKKFEEYDYIDENKLREAESRDELIKMAEEMKLTKEDLINIAYEETNNIDTAIPMSLYDDLNEFGGTTWFVMDYQEDDSFGKLVHLADKILGNDIDWWKKLDKD